MPQSFDVWYVTSPSGTLPSLLKLWLLETDPRKRGQRIHLAYDEICSELG